MRVPLPVRDATEQVWQSLSKARFVIALVAVAVVNAGPASSCADELLVTISSSEGAAANMVRYNTLLAVEQPGSCSGRIELCRPLPQVRVFLHQDAPIGSLVAAAPLDEKLFDSFRIDGGNSECGFLISAQTGWISVGSNAVPYAISPAEYVLTVSARRRHQSLTTSGAGEQPGVGVGPSLAHDFEQSLIESGVRVTDIQQLRESRVSATVVVRVRAASAAESKPKSAVERFTFDSDAFLPLLEKANTVFDDGRAAFEAVLARIGENLKKLEPPHAIETDSAAEALAFETEDLQLEPAPIVQSEETTSVRWPSSAVVSEEFEANDDPELGNVTGVDRLETGSNRMLSTLMSLCCVIAGFVVYAARRANGRRESDSKRNEQGIRNREGGKTTEEAETIEYELSDSTLLELFLSPNTTRPLNVAEYSAISESKTAAQKKFSSGTSNEVRDHHTATERPRPDGDDTALLADAVASNEQVEGPRQTLRDTTMLFRQISRQAAADAVSLATLHRAPERKIRIAILSSLTAASLAVAVCGLLGILEWNLFSRLLLAATLLSAAEYRRFARRWRVQTESEMSGEDPRR